MSNNKQKQSLALHTTALGIGSMMMTNFASAAVVTGTGFDVQANHTGVIVPGLELQNNTYYEVDPLFGGYTWHSEVKLVSADLSVSFSDVTTGTLIGPSTAFGSTSTTVYNTHNGKYNGTSGLQNALYGFKINSGGQVNYGWADISTIDNGLIGNYQSLTARVNAFAYSTAGESLVAGVTTPVPEPEALSLLAGGLGLVAIAAKRRRKHTADQGQRAKLAA